MDGRWPECRIWCWDFPCFHPYLEANLLFGLHICQKVVPTCSALGSMASQPLYWHWNCFRSHFFYEWELWARPASLVWFGFILFCLSSILTINFLSELTIVFTRQLSEKMVLGALLLEGDNYEFWVALGCLSGHNALRQHALIRGLQLDVSLAVAWAYLGKVLA